MTPEGMGSLTTLANPTVPDVPARLTAVPVALLKPVMPTLPKLMVPPVWPVLWITFTDVVALLTKFSAPALTRH